MPYGVDPADATMMARTMWGENTQGSPDEYTAMANVMRNRLSSGDYGDTMSDVLRAKNQFQAWNNPGAPNYPMKAPADSPAFRMAYQAATNVMSGENAPSDFVNYYNPKGVNKTPSFAAGRQGTPIGQHVFYGPQSGLSDEDKADIEKYYPKQKATAPDNLTDEDKADISKYYPDSKGKPKTGEQQELERETASNRVAGAFEQFQPHGPYTPIGPGSAMEPGLREVGLSSETLLQLVGAYGGGSALLNAPRVLSSIVTKGIPAALKVAGIGTVGGLASALASEALGPEKGAKVMDLVRHAIHYSE